MVVRPGQQVTVTGADGEPHRGVVLNVYRSTGGVTTVWIDLGRDPTANPANRFATQWSSSVLVLTERKGVYRDLWLQAWKIEV